MHYLRTESEHETRNKCTRLLKKFYTGATSVRCEVGWKKIKWFIYLCEGLKGPIFEPCSAL